MLVSILFFFSSSPSPSLRLSVLLVLVGFRHRGLIFWVSWEESPPQAV